MSDWEPLPVQVEVWPVAADARGIWLLSGTKAWRTQAPLAAGLAPDAAVDAILSDAVACDDMVLRHSTSWRADLDTVVLTYLVVLRCVPPVRLRWPGASLFTVRGGARADDLSADSLFDRADVLLHGLRHLRFLLTTDNAVEEALPHPWPVALSSLAPAFAGMYRTSRTPRAG